MKNLPSNFHEWGARGKLWEWGRKGKTWAIRFHVWRNLLCICRGVILKVRFWGLIFFCKGLESKYFRLCESYSRSYTLPTVGFPGCSDYKESACQSRRPRFDPWVGKTSGKGNGYSFQYSCLENSMDRGAWHSTVHKVTKSQTQFNDFYSLSLMVSAVTTQLFPCKLCSNKTLHKETEI